MRLVRLEWGSREGTEGRCVGGRGALGRCGQGRGVTRLLCERGRETSAGRPARWPLAQSGEGEGRVCLGFVNGWGAGVN